MAWIEPFSLPIKKVKIICEILPMEGFSPSFEEHMTLNCIKSLCLQVYQVMCKYQLDFLKALFVPCQSFRNIFKSLSSLSLGTFLLIRYETSFLNLKAHFLQYKKNNSTLNCTHNNFFNRIAFTCKFMKWIWIGKKKEQLD